VRLLEKLRVGRGGGGGVEGGISPTICASQTLVHDHTTRSTLSALNI
jgi:hypothetical protein